MAPTPPVVRKHFVNPCMLFVHWEEHVIATLLGSCVSVCLWDTRLGYGGINHYMLPLWNGAGLPTPKYGNIAIEKLIQNLNNLGCRKEDLIAKVFGGANVINLGREAFSVGERNIHIAKETLGRHGIPIRAIEVGGGHAMKIEFNSKTGIVIVRKVSQNSGVPSTLPEAQAYHLKSSSSTQ